MTKAEISMAWSKKAAVGIGVAMGLLATFTAMLPSSHKSEAAIAVIDQQNIEEAAKTAIQTAKILTEEQKKYALMLLQLKKLDASIFQEFAKDEFATAESRKWTDIAYPQGTINNLNSLKCLMAILTQCSCHQLTKRIKTVNYTTC